MPIANRKIKTSHGTIAVADTGGSGVPVLFLHGNSSRKEVFRNQFEGALAKSCRMIAMDLPGNGASDDAADPGRTYSLPGLADAALELLDAMDVERAAIFGWSLGGHVAIEMLARSPAIVGLMVTGTPPIRCTMESIQEGFRPNPLVMLIGKESFSDEEVEAFGVGTYGAFFDADMRAAIERADGRMRRMTFENLLAGIPADQRKTVEETEVPVAFVNGADDPFVNLDYLGGLAVRNLWDRHSHVLRGVGHVPFIEAPDAFNAILGRFLVDMTAAAARPHKRKSRIAAA